MLIDAVEITDPQRRQIVGQSSALTEDRPELLDGEPRVHATGKPGRDVLARLVVQVTRALRG